MPAVFSRPRILKSLPMGPLSLLWLLLASPARSQEVAPPTNKVVPPATRRLPPPPELKELFVLWSRGQFDDLIEQANLALTKRQTPDPYIVFWRGYAEQRIGHFDAALKDFQSLGDFSDSPKLPNSTQMAAKVASIIALRPPIEHVVRIKDKVVFRVYTTADTPFSDNVIASLPKGYQAAARFLHQDVEEIPVFIFTEDKYDQFIQFNSAIGGSVRKSWRIFVTSGGIAVSQRNDYDNVFESDVTTLPQSVAHELTHLIMLRALGTFKDIPNWFVEGSAQMVGAAIAPQQYTLNDQTVKRLIQQGAILPLDQITTYANFHENVDQRWEGKTKGDPYSQGFNMTRYLGFLLKGSRFSDFLTLMQKNHSLEDTIKETTNLTMPQFYDSWLKTVRSK